MIFAFIDAANIVDLFSDTEVIHFEEGNPDSFAYPGSGEVIYQAQLNSIHNSFPTTNFGSHAKKKSTLPKLLIYDQDSPSVVHDFKKEEESIFKFEPSDYVIPETQSISKTIYIENCQLQI